jgi:hypothetical protein
MSRANESAYPYQHVASPGSEVGYGLTIREYFAAMAMQGLLASGKWCVNEVIGHTTAEYSVRAADALLAELTKVTP